MSLKKNITIFAKKEIIMKRIVTTLVLALATIGAFAQKPALRPRIEIVKTESEDGSVAGNSLEVFYMKDDEPRMYYLSVGNLGIGDNIVQLEIDPIYELFIPLGNTLEESIATLEQFKAFYKQPKNSTMETNGSFAALYPKDELIPVTVTRRQSLASKLLEFSIPAKESDAIRATYISKSEFSGIISSLKFYKKLHPKTK